MKIKGYTLIEVLIAALIASIVGLGVVYAIANSNNILTESVVEAFKNTNSQRIMDLIAVDVRRGARMSSFDPNTLIIMDANDKILYTWNCSEEIITRTFHSESGENISRKIKVFSTAKRKIKPVIIFTTSITGQFYNVKVDMYLKEYDLSSNIYNSSKLTNIFYCRLDPLL